MGLVNYHTKATEKKVQQLSKVVSLNSSCPFREGDKMKQGGEREEAEKKNRISNSMKPNEIYVGMQHL